MVFRWGRSAIVRQYIIEIRLLLHRFVVFYVFLPFEGYIEQIFGNIYKILLRNFCRAIWVIENREIASALKFAISQAVNRLWARWIWSFTASTPSWCSSIYGWWRIPSVYYIVTGPSCSVSATACSAWSIT